MTSSVLRDVWTDELYTDESFPTTVMEKIVKET